MSARKSRRKVWIAAGVAVVIIVVTPLVLILMGRTAPDIPHAAKGRSPCTSCHVLVRLPDNHHARTDDSCVECHSPGSS